MSQPHDDENPLSPQESLRLITDQQQRTNRAYGGDPLMYWAPWGITWLIGFGLFFLKYGLNGHPYVDMPENLPLIVLFALMACAIAATSIAGARATRHIQGHSNTQGMMFGLSWFFAFVTVAAVAVRMSPMLPDDERGLLWAGLAVGMTGALYLAGAAIWREWSMFAMGLWLTVINAIGVTLGAGWHALLVSVAGGGGLLVCGLLLRLKYRREAS